MKELLILIDKGRSIRAVGETMKEVLEDAVRGGLPTSEIEDCLILTSNRNKAPEFSLN